jgi:hypothetical protein
MIVFTTAPLRELIALDLCYHKARDQQRHPAAQVSDGRTFLFQTSLVRPKETRSMTRAADSSDTPVQTPLAELMVRYLQHQADAHAAGLAAVEVVGEVVPFDAAPAPSVDPRIAWVAAVAATPLFRPEAETGAWPVPPEWPVLVAGLEPANAPAFALGNYPQLVRHVRPLLTATDLPALRPAAGRPVSVPALTAWATRQSTFPQLLLALGLLRLAGQFDEADALLTQHGKVVPEAWRAAWTNEAAALLWHRGRTEEAAASWAKQAESVPVLFNRGLAALFLGRPAEARTWLRQASEQLPEAGAWHHLAGLYLALAEMRG